MVQRERLSKVCHPLLLVPLFESTVMISLLLVILELGAALQENEALKSKINKLKGMLAKKKEATGPESPDVEAKDALSLSGSDLSLKKTPQQ